MRMPIFWSVAITVFVDGHVLGFTNIAEDTCGVDFVSVYSSYMA